MSIDDTLNQFLSKAKGSGCQQLRVAYSGGVDSHVLLHALAKLTDTDKAINLDAIYINHQLHSSSADWGIHCQKICQSLNLSFLQIKVSAQANSGESPEEKARQARYEAFESVIKEGQWLITAQHQDDQAETLILQLLRGSGVEGLASMPSERKFVEGEHHRPLLSISREEILEYAHRNSLSWIEDPSNQDKSIARNYLRKSVLPTFNERWPEFNQMFSRSANWLAEASTLLAEVAEGDLSTCLGQEQSISLGKFKLLSTIRQKNVLRFWFHKLGLKRPGDKKLKVIFEQIIFARDDASPLLEWQGVTVRRFNNFLYCLPTLPEVDTTWHKSWKSENELALMDDWAKLISEKVIGRGLAVKYIDSALTLKVRQGGEYCQPQSRDKKRSLKKLLQEYSVPTFYRDRWPLLYKDEQLVAVPGLFICKGFEAIEGEEGIELKVRRKQSNFDLEIK